MSGSEGMMLRVKTEKLVEVAGQVEGEISALRTRFESISDIVNGSASYWEAQGQTAYVQKYREKSGTVEEALQRFQSNVDSLKIIANVYSATEKTIEADVQGLSSDIII